jgi:SAM-dependent methyltransferase
MATMQERTVEYYRAVARGYDQTFKTPMHSIMDAEEKEVIGIWLTGSRSVLDVGCGTGRILRFLREWGARPVGLDISRPMLEVARTLNPGVDLVQATAESLPFMEGSFDAATSAYGCLSHVESFERAMAEIARVARHRAVFSVYGRLGYKVLLKATALIRSPLHSIKVILSGGPGDFPAEYYSSGDLLSKVPKRAEVAYVGALNLLPMLIPNAVPLGSRLVRWVAWADKYLIRSRLLREAAGMLVVSVKLHD